MDNRVSVTGWTMRGSAYRNGMRFPGCTILFLSDGRSRYYPEEVAIGPALDREQLEHGTDTSDARAKLNNWVKTGEGVTFGLTR